MSAQNRFHRVLLIEDNPGDVRLTQEAFKEGGDDTKIDVNLCTKHNEELLAAATCQQNTCSEIENQVLDKNPSNTDCMVKDETNGMDKEMEDLSQTQIDNQAIIDMMESEELIDSTQCAEKVDEKSNEEDLLATQVLVEKDIEVQSNFPPFEKNDGENKFETPVKNRNKDSNQISTTSSSDLSNVDFQTPVKH